MLRHFISTWSHFTHSLGALSPAPHASKPPLMCEQLGDVNPDACYLGSQ